MHRARIQRREEHEGTPLVDLRALLLHGRPPEAFPSQPAQTLLRGASVVHRLEEDYPFAQTAVFEYPGFPRLHFIEDRYAGDPTYWWIPNLACAEAMLRSAGFRIEEHPELDVFVCRRGERRGQVEEVLRWARD